MTRLIIMIGCIVLMTVAACTRSDQDAERLRTRLEALPVGNALAVGNVAGRKAIATCLLGPYMDRLPPDAPQAERVNAYLKSINYVAHEGIWSLIRVMPEAVQVLQFHRSSELDLASSSLVAKMDTVAIPLGFVATSCVTGSEAWFAKISYEDRNYVILGRR